LEVIMAQGRRGAAPRSEAYRNRVSQQQAVLDRLRSGGAVTGARPANPIIGMLQNLTGVGAGAVPNLYAAQLGGQEVLLGKGGWNQTTAATGPINVGGRTWYPAQKGQDLVYRPGTEGGQYGSILPQQGKGDPAAERAYEQEKSRVAQLTEQDPELKRYEEASKKAKTQEEMDAARDIGMAIWARSNPKLAAKVKPGQSGYEVIQNELNAGQMGPVLDLPFDSTKPFSPTPIPPEQRSVTYEGVRPVSLGEVTPITGGGFPTQQFAAFDRFRQAISPAPTFQGSPLGTTSPLVGNLSYTGSVTPLGGTVEEGDFRSAKAQELADAFRKARFSS
jgi:hypothetical protein